MQCKSRLYKACTCALVWNREFCILARIFNYYCHGLTLKSACHWKVLPRTAYFIICTYYFSRQASKWCQNTGINQGQIKEKLCWSWTPIKTCCHFGDKVWTPKYPLFILDIILTTLFILNKTSIFRGALVVFFFLANRLGSWQRHSIVHSSHMTYGDINLSTTFCILLVRAEAFGFSLFWIIILSLICQTLETAVNATLSDVKCIPHI